MIKKLLLGDIVVTIAMLAVQYHLHIHGGSKAMMYPLLAICFVMYWYTDRTMKNQKKEQYEDIHIRTVHFGLVLVAVFAFFWFFGPVLSLSIKNPLMEFLLSTPDVFTFFLVLSIPRFIYQYYLVSRTEEL